MDTKEVGEKLVGLCKEGKNLEAVNSLYSEDIVSVEPMAMPNMPAEQSGLDAIRGKNQWWIDNHEIHSSDVQGPYVHGDRFAARFVYDITSKSGPMEGQRNTMEEVAVYDVKDGKVVREEFYY